MTTPSFSSKFAVGQWVEFRWQEPPGTWRNRWGLIADAEWWPFDPKEEPYQEESWGYRMEGYTVWLYELDINRKLSLLEVIALVSREEGE